jgi:hypothetical protein
LLVGGADDYAPGLERLPFEIARCSFDYFITSSKSDQNAQLATEIVHRHRTYVDCGDGHHPG